MIVNVNHVIDMRKQIIHITLKMNHQKYYTILLIKILMK